MVVLVLRRMLRVAAGRMAWSVVLFDVCAAVVGEGCSLLWLLAAAVHVSHADVLSVVSANPNALLHYLPYL